MSRLPSEPAAVRNQRGRPEFHRSAIKLAIIRPIAPAPAGIVARSCTVPPPAIFNPRNSATNLQPTLVAADQAQGERCTAKLGPRAFTDQQILVHRDRTRNVMLLSKNRRH